MVTKRNPKKVIKENTEEVIDWYNGYEKEEVESTSGCSVKVARVSDKAKLPKYAHKGDACFDLSIIIDRDFIPFSKWECNRDVKYIIEEDCKPVGDEMTKVFFIDILPRSEAIFSTGLKFEVPEGYVLKVYPRSSTGIKKGLILSNCTGIIDSTYRGELMIALANLTNYPIRIYDGDRVAQGAIERVLDINFTEVSEEELSDTNRGEGGIGSTGDK